MAFCLQCGNEIKDGAKFCAKCGCAVPAAAQSVPIEKRCASCGTVLKDGVKFCAKCGCAVSAAEVQVAPIEKRCVSCGTVLKDGVKFCPKCGRAVSADVSAVSPPPVAIQQQAAVTPPQTFEPQKKKNTKRNMLIAVAGVVILALVFIALPLLFRGIASTSLYDNHDYDKAIKYYNMAIGLSPLLPYVRLSSYESLGSAYRKKGLYDEAIRYYTKAITYWKTMLKSHNFSSLYEWRGGAYADKGDYERAIADYNELIQYNLYNSNLYITRSDFYMRIKRFDLAIADLENALRLPYVSAELVEVINNRIKEARRAQGRIIAE